MDSGHPLATAAGHIRFGEDVPLALATLVSHDLSKLWDSCTDDVPMREWLFAARLLTADMARKETRCRKDCGRWACSACCDVIRNNFPTPPTLAELLAARVK